MKYKNFLVKIIKFGLVASSFFINDRLLAENLKSCPENLPKEGVHLYPDLKVTSTFKKSLIDPLNNPDLQEYIALLKLKVVKRHHEFVHGTTYTSEPTKYGGKRITKKSNATPYQKKLSLVSMRGIGACIKEGVIFFSGEWTKESITSANRVIQFEEGMEKLRSLRQEDPKFNFLELVKKYPNFSGHEDPTSTDDMKNILEAIENWKKYRRFE